MIASKTDAPDFSSPESSARQNLKISRRSSTQQTTERSSIINKFTVSENSSIPLKRSTSTSKMPSFALEHTKERKFSYLRRQKVKMQNSPSKLNHSGIDLKLPNVTFPRIATPPLTFSSFSVPKITLPNVTFPKINFPSVTIPSVEIPKITMPNITFPKIDYSSITMPSVEIPKITFPSVTFPKIDIPNVTFPSVKLPKVTLPHVTFPKINLPSVPLTSATPVRITRPEIPYPNVTFPNFEVPIGTLLPMLHSNVTPHSTG